MRRFASLEYAAGRHDQAAILLQNAFARFPEHYELAYSLGQVRRGAGDDEGALEAFLSVPPEQAVYLEARTQVVAIYEQRADGETGLMSINIFNSAAAYARDGRPFR